MFPSFRFRRKLQGRLQSLPPARLRTAPQNKSGSRRVPAHERVHPAVHVRRQRHSDLPQLLRAELQGFTADPTETPESQVELQFQTGNSVPQQRQQQQ